MGRRTKLTPELQDQICGFLTLHNTVEHTCEVLGIHKATFYRWLEKGEEGTMRKYRDFSDAIKKAQAQSVIVLTSGIAKDPSWQAKAWLLERLHPKTFGRRQLLEHTTPADELPVRIEGGNQPAVQIVIASADDEWNESDDKGEPEAQDAATLADGTAMPGDTEL